MATGDGNDHPLYQKRAEAAPASSAGKAKRPRQPLRQQALLTYGLVAVNALVYLAGFVSQPLEWELFLRGALFPRLVVEYGEVYRLFTAMFLHGSLGHVFFNIYALLIFGRSLEPVFGWVRLLLIYLLGGLTGSALSLWLGGLDGASVGASGAVFAIFAAQGVHLYLNRKVYPNVRAQLRHMAFLVGINLFIGFMPGSRIDNWGHIGGMLGGALLSWRIGPRIALVAGLDKLGQRVVAAVDRNPLQPRWYEVALYAAALAGLVVAAVVLLGA